MPKNRPTTPRTTGVVAHLHRYAKREILYARGIKIRRGKGVCAGKLLRELVKMLPVVHVDNQISHDLKRTKLLRNKASVTI
jgi:hypothetical protein